MEATHLVESVCCNSTQYCFTIGFNSRELFKGPFRDILNHSERIMMESFVFSIDNGRTGETLLTAGRSIAETINCCMLPSVANDGGKLLFCFTFRSSPALNRSSSQVPSTFIRSLKWSLVRIAKLIAHDGSGDVELHPILRYRTNGAPCKRKYCERRKVNFSTGSP